ncbi:hypothetical protein JSY14_06440 [Brachybacterium sp. EF45031]|uniref:hypothetical protein n=1 Tax=Brachybacterium sillae TaxID=2810536 RepID=UPI00217CEE7B|nr:hypothetical protein [Brachybacterium sillae]MCS6711677.1 hypothetical protein [Brachybacterium sillae]
MVLFIIATLALMIVLLFGSDLGWADPVVLALVAVALVTGVGFVIVERRQRQPFIALGLFRNPTFTGAVVSNFLMNATVGMLLVSQQLVQLAGHRPDGSRYTAMDAGLMSLGYAVFVIGFIRVGEKLLQRVGPRKPMIWGPLIVMVATVMLMMTHVMVGTYVILAIIAYSLFGLGLAL